MISFEINQQSGKNISEKLLQKWLKKIENVLKIKKNTDISIGIVGDGAIKKLNKDYRSKDKVTDVLSFSENDSKVKTPMINNYLGEIIICYPQAVRQAKKIGHPVNKEIELLLIHGFLHLLGHDHEKTKETKIMRDLEQRILDF